MKKISITLLTLSLFSFSCSSSKENLSIKKEVRMEDENGTKTLTVTTTENGKTIKQVFKGELAEKELKKIESKDCCEGNEKCEKKIIKKEVNIEKS